MTHKTKAIINLEGRMEGLDPAGIRYQILEDVKIFKTSWIRLGQVLYSVWKDKLYKDWGYEEFDSYTAKEIGIKKTTAFKLLKSYSFLENKEPRYLAESCSEEARPSKIPDYEAVDILRKTENNKNMEPEDYEKIRKYVLVDGKDVKEVKKDLVEMIKQNEQLLPAEERKRKRLVLVKRFIGQVKAIEKELKMLNMLPDNILRELTDIINKIETKIEE
jgi:hypothetical protein